VAAAVVSCRKDPLALKKNNTWDDETNWRLPASAEGVLMKAYNGIPNLPDNFDNNFLDAATDNALTSDHTSSAWLAGNGGFSRTNSVIGNWTQCYNMFQYIHIFLDNGLTDATLYDRVNETNDANIKRRLEGEAYFLRAWWGFQLLQRYGGRSVTGEALGYPIVTEFIDRDNVGAPELLVRNSYEECVDQITTDCEAAAERLPLVYDGAGTTINSASHIGRASATAAYLLRSTVLLYAASPAYQDDDIVEISAPGEFTVTDAIAAQIKWGSAAIAANDVLTLDGFGEFNAINSGSLVNASAATPSEFVFRRYTNNRNMEERHNPPFNHGQALTVPSDNLARAFPARNGFPIDDPRSLYDENAPYAIERDRRMELNIYRHGSVYNSELGSIDIIYGGKDSPAYSPYASRTGYYLAKFISNRTVVKDTPTNNVRYYPYLRKAEAFLNYAEAANEAWGPEAKPEGCLYSAYEIVKIIRELSGGITDTEYLDEMAASKETFRTLIQNERRLELAFENHRFFDMRRWLLPLDETVQGMEVINGTNGIEYRVTDVEQRPMNDLRYYYLPLPESELLKSASMVNNTGW
jgi:hypothetical protein